MKQNIYYKTQIDSLVKTLKLDVKDSPYFIGSSSQATIQRSSTDCSEFSAALVFCDSEWKIIRFAEEEHSSEFATLSSTNLNPKAILENYTDLEKAIRHCLALGMSSINVLGVFGGRLDHTLSNAFMLHSVISTLEPKPKICLYDSFSKL